jgi:hypothetical protein
LTVFQKIAPGDFEVVLKHCFFYQVALVAFCSEENARLANRLRSIVYRLDASPNCTIPIHQLSFLEKNIPETLVTKKVSLVLYPQSEDY